MTNATILVLVFIVVSLAALAGMALLQVYLSKKESRWPGLVLPALCLLSSLVIVFGVVLFQFSGSQSMQVIGQGGQVVSQVTGAAASLQLRGELAGAAVLFLLCNLPTAVLLAIYAACRGKRKKQQALQKMSALDLE